MDKVIFVYVCEENLEYLMEGYMKIDEILFDFSWCWMLVVIED